MNVSTAIKYLKQHRFADAESLLKKAYQADCANGSVVASLMLSLMHQKKFKNGRKIAVEVIEGQQFDDNFYINLALMFLELGQPESAVVCFEKIVLFSPDNCDAVFNLAFCYNKNNQPGLALTHYRKLVSKPLEYLDDVHLNIANILNHQKTYIEASNEYQKALSINPENKNAWFNLASLYEQLNQKRQAKSIYHRLLSLDPNHLESTVRLIYMDKVKDENNSYVNKLNHCLKSIKLNDFDKEMAHFGLGKACDDVGRFDAAFAHYKAANELGKLRMSQQVGANVGKAFNFENIEVKVLPELDAKQTEPIFICGMYRSGSTLIEKVLCSHSKVDAGGEVDFFKTQHEELIALLKCTAEQQKQMLMKLRQSYCARISSSNRYIIDKSPTNIRYLKLIKIMFPRAKIIISRREALDCCLSLYFQMFNADLPFANDLEAIFDEYVSCDAIISCHLDIIKNVYVQNYEGLVADQVNQTKALLRYCELEWQLSCLDFHNNESQVNTASIWQVRQPMYNTSVGRWKNYKNHIKGLMKLVSNYKNHHNNIIDD